LQGLKNLSLTLPSLAAFPDCVLFLHNLLNLDLSLSASVAVLPEALGQMLALTSLRLCKCESITLLPQSITRLSRLDNLVLEVMGGGCHSVAEWCHCLLFSLYG
jgi:hypothetical protein